MKKFLAFVAMVALLAACNNSSESEQKTDTLRVTPSTDSVTLGADSIQRAADSLGGVQ